MVAFSFNNHSAKALGSTLAYARASQECPIKETLPIAFWGGIVWCSLTVGCCRTGSVRGQGGREGEICGLRDGTSSSTNPCEICRENTGLSKTHFGEFSL